MSLIGSFTFLLPAQHPAWLDFHTVSVLLQARSAAALVHASEHVHKLLLVTAVQFILGKDVITQPDLQIQLEVWDYAWINHFKVRTKQLRSAR